MVGVALSRSAHLAMPCCLFALAILVTVLQLLMVEIVLLSTHVSATTAHAVSILNVNTFLRVYLHVFATLVGLALFVIRVTLVSTDLRVFKFLLEVQLLLKLGRPVGTLNYLYGVIISMQAVLIRFDCSKARFLCF
jgi:hypothetical protein